MKKTDYPLQDSIGFLISSTHRTLRPLLESRVSGAGVSYGMWFFLRVLWDEDGMSQREIADRVGMSKPTTLAALRKLERLKLVELKPDATDGRRVQVFLTKKGRALEGELLPNVEEINTIVLRGLTKADVKELRRMLSTIQANAAASL